MSAEARYDVLWPLGRKAVQPRAAAAGVADLSGKTVCELWDYIFRGEIIYPHIRARLRERFPGIRFIEYAEFGNIHGPRQREIVAGLAARLKALGCDAVISGIGA